MDSALPPPALTAVAAVTQSLGAALYVAIALAAWARAPRDIRTRVFLGLAAASALAYTPEAIAYASGIRDASKLPRSFTATITAALATGALLMFHLTQVFPRRRPWIRGAGFQMSVAYLLTPLAVTGLLWFAPASAADISRAYVVAVIVFGFPLLVLLVLVIPIAAIVSIARSYRECGTAELERARPPLAAILVSQVGGGALAVVFAPVLATVAPASIAATALTLVIWAIGLVTPAAFAVAVWKLDVLSIDPS